MRWVKPKERACSSRYPKTATATGEVPMNISYANAVAQSLSRDCARSIMELAAADKACTEREFDQALKKYVEKFVKAA